MVRNISCSLFCVPHGGQGQRKESLAPLEQLREDSRYSKNPKTKDRISTSFVVSAGSTPPPPLPRRRLPAPAAEKKASCTRAITEGGGFGDGRQHDAVEFAADGAYSHNLAAVVDIQVSSIVQPEEGSIKVLRSTIGPVPS